MSETKEQYLKHVQSILDQAPNAVASYDTGYGLHLVAENLGDSPMTLVVIQYSLGKIRPPSIEGEAWYDAWDAAKRLVRTHTKEY